MARFGLGQMADDDARQPVVPPSLRHPAVHERSCRTILGYYRRLEEVAIPAIKRCSNRQMDASEAKLLAYDLRHTVNLIRIHDAQPTQCTTAFTERMSRLDGSTWDAERLRRIMTDSGVAIGLLKATASPQYPRLMATFSPEPSVPSETERRDMLPVVLLFVVLPLLVILIAILNA